MRLKSSLFGAWAIVVVLAIAPGVPSAAANGGSAGSEHETGGFEPAMINSFAGAVLAAHIAEADRDVRAAIGLYRRAREFDRENADLRRRLMLLLFADGGFDEGLALAEDLESNAAVNPIRQLALGVDAIRRQRFDKAKALLDYQGVDSLERLLHGLMRAWSLYGEDKGETARETIATLEGPTWYGIFKAFHGAALEEALGNTEAARRQFTAIIADRSVGETAPDTYILAALALARLEAATGDTRKALDALATAEAFAPGHAPITGMNKRVKAGNPPRSAIATAGEGAAAALYTIASALDHGGNEDIVLLYLNFARALDPNNAAILVRLGGVAEALGDPARAAAFYQAVPENSILNRSARMRLGLNLANLGQLERARQSLRALIDEDPSDMRAYLAYGSILSEAKDYQAMADNYDRAVLAIGAIADRSHWNIYYQRGIAYERLKEWNKAEPNFKRSLALNPFQPQVMNYLGYSWIDMNIHLEEGMELIREAVRLRPDDGYIVDSLGWAHYRIGDFEDAVRELERAVELRPGDPTINDHLGDAYWRAGRRLEAGYQWQRALTMQPELSDIPKIKAKIEKGLPDEPVKAPSAANGNDLGEPAEAPLPADGPKKSLLDRHGDRAAPT